VQGHFKDELWGMCCHPEVCQVATVGDEGTVRVWDALRRQMAHMRVSTTWWQSTSFASSINNDLPVALYYSISRPKLGPSATPLLVSI